MFSACCFYENPHGTKFQRLSKKNKSAPTVEVKKDKGGHPIFSLDLDSSLALIISCYLRK